MEAARRALPGDLTACGRLLGEARDRGIALRGGPALLADCELPAPPSPVDEVWLATHWEGAERALFAGTIDDEVVGVAMGRLAHRDAERVGAVVCCYVETDARGVGVGTALAEELFGWFRANGCAAVDAPALPGDRATKQLFESQGLSARLLILHRRLP